MEKPEDFIKQKQRVYALHAFIEELASSAQNVQTTVAMNIDLTKIAQILFELVQELQRLAAASDVESFIDDVDTTPRRFIYRVDYTNGAPTSVEIGWQTAQITDDTPNPKSVDQMLRSAQIMKEVHSKLHREFIKKIGNLKQTLLSEGSKLRGLETSVSQFPSVTRNPSGWMHSSRQEFRGDFVLHSFKRANELMKTHPVDESTIFGRFSAPSRYNGPQSISSTIHNSFRQTFSSLFGDSANSPDIAQTWEDYVMRFEQAIRQSTQPSREDAESNFSNFVSEWLLSAGVAFSSYGRAIANKTDVPLLFLVPGRDFVSYPSKYFTQVVPITNAVKPRNHSSKGKNVFFFCNNVSPDTRDPRSFDRVCERVENLTQISGIVPTPCAFLMWHDSKIGNTLNVLCSFEFPQTSFEIFANCSESAAKTDDCEQQTANKHWHVYSSEPIYQSQRHAILALADLSDCICMLYKHKTCCVSFGDNFVLDVSGHDSNFDNKKRKFMFPHVSSRAEFDKSVETAINDMPEAEIAQCKYMESIEKIIEYYKKLTFQSESEEDRACKTKNHIIYCVIKGCFPSAALVDDWLLDILFENKWFIDLSSCFLYFIERILLCLPESEKTSVAFLVCTIFKQIAIEEYEKSQLVSTPNMSRDQRTAFSVSNVASLFSEAMRELVAILSESAYIQFFSQDEIESLRETNGDKTFLQLLKALARIAPEKICETVSLIDEMVQQKKQKGCDLSSSANSNPLYVTRDQIQNFTSFKILCAMTPDCDLLLSQRGETLHSFPRKSVIPTSMEEFTESPCYPCEGYESKGLLLEELSECNISIAPNGLLHFGTNYGALQKVLSSHGKAMYEPFFPFATPIANNGGFYSPSYCILFRSHRYTPEAVKKTQKEAPAHFKQAEPKRKSKRGGQKKHEETEKQEQGTVAIPESGTIASKERVSCLDQLCVVNFITEASKHSRFTYNQQKRYFELANEEKFCPVCNSITCEVDVGTFSIFLILVASYYKNLKFSLFVDAQSGNIKTVAETRMNGFYFPFPIDPKILENILSCMTTHKIEEISAVDAKHKIAQVANTRKMMKAIYSLNTEQLFRIVTVLRRLTDEDTSKICSPGFTIINKSDDVPLSSFDEIGRRAATTTRQLGNSAYVRLSRYFEGKLQARPETIPIQILISVANEMDGIISPTGYIIGKCCSCSIDYRSQTEIKQEEGIKMCAIIGGKDITPALRQHMQHNFSQCESICQGLAIPLCRTCIFKKLAPICDFISQQIGEKMANEFVAAFPTRENCDGGLFADDYYTLVEMLVDKIKSKTLTETTPNQTKLKQPVDNRRKNPDRCPFEDFSSKFFAKVLDNETALRIVTCATGMLPNADGFYATLKRSEECFDITIAAPSFKYANASLFTFSRPQDYINPLSGIHIPIDFFFNIDQRRLTLSPASMEIAAPRITKLLSFKN